MNILAVRGAITVDESREEGRAMINAAGTLMKALAEVNGFSPESVISVQLTQTKDLRDMNAASALRTACPEYSSVPLFCSQEPDVLGALPRTIRVLVTWSGTGPAVPVYAGGATDLRPDLIKNK
jgi:chorismate mutase